MAQMVKNLPAMQETRVFLLLGVKFMKDLATNGKPSKSKKFSSSVSPSLLLLSKKNH